ncbi:hypothetical protein DPMN_194642 [Dreissena polymorpha]|uniref:Uncharacterized protein n=1 Tax=Dreissena polymorpha TaxID=45954 RepID=A0A9D4BC32_DREPO|nr:hypothetical protein DPMN_194642 [Dreissena polymorpha]
MDTYQMTWPARHWHANCWSPSSHVQGRLQEGLQIMRHPDKHLGDIEPRWHRFPTVYTKRRRGSRGKLNSPSAQSPEPPLCQQEHE